MAATDMAKAGLEVGAKVASKMSGHVGFIAELDAFCDVDPKATIKLTDGSFYRPDEIERDYAEAQQTRHQRFDDRIYNVYAGDAGVPQGTSTIERFVLVQKGADGDHSFRWSDDCNQLLAQAALDVSDGLVPIEFHDLDCDLVTKLEVHAAVHEAIL